MLTRELKTEIIRYCQRMDQKQWVANHDGNISVKTAAGTLAATPTARAKFDLSDDDLLELDLSGKLVSGNGKPFSELAIHLKVYQARPDITAVVHAHPPNATAVGMANQEMLTWAVPEAVISLGPGVPLVGMALPNSNELWGELEPLLPYYDAVMIAGNGVFAWGKSLEQAFLRLELVEHLAQTLLKSLPLGGPKLLDAAQVGELLKKRSQAGLALPIDPARPHWFPSATHSR